jgi:two-component system chemotaxis sensor kinase CheA
MEFDHTELLRVFIAEAEENLAAIEDGLLQLEARPDDTRQLDHVFRAAHTLKGNSGSLGFAGMADLAHEAEQILERMRCGEIRADADLISLLSSTVHALKRSLPSLQTEAENAMDDEQRRVWEHLRTSSSVAEAAGR